MKTKQNKKKNTKKRKNGHFLYRWDQNEMLIDFNVNEKTKFQKDSNFYFYFIR